MKTDNNTAEKFLYIDGKKFLASAFNSAQYAVLKAREEEAQQKALYHKLTDARMHNVFCARMQKYFTERACAVTGTETQTEKAEREQREKEAYQKQYEKEAREKASACVLYRQAEKTHAVRTIDVQYKIFTQVCNGMYAVRMQRYFDNRKREVEHTAHVQKRAREDALIFNRDTEASKAVHRKAEEAQHSRTLKYYAQKEAEQKRITWKQIDQWYAERDTAIYTLLNILSRTGKNETEEQVKLTISKKRKGSTRKKEVVYKIVQMHGHTAQYECSDIISSIFTHYARIFVCSALKTAYVNSGNPYMFLFWQKARSYNAQYGIVNYNLPVKTQVRISKKYKDKITGKFMLRKKPVVVQEVTEDTAKILDVSDKYKETYGEEVKIDRSTQVEIDTEELINCAVERMYLLYCANQITCVNDIILNKNCVYSAINAEITAQKNSYIERDAYKRAFVCFITGNDAEDTCREKVVSEKQFDKYRVETEAIINAVRSAVHTYINTHFRSNRAEVRDFDTAWNNFMLVHVSQYTQAQAGKITHCSQRVVCKQIVSIRSVLQTKEVLDAVREIVYA